jgi:hypothetical protein
LERGAGGKAEKLKSGKAEPERSEDGPKANTERLKSGLAGTPR